MLDRDAYLASIAGRSLRDKVLDDFQLAIDVVGLVPFLGEVADGVNAVIYLAREDYVNASLSGAAMVPFADGALQEQCC
jgi:hypothetical protein